MLNSQEQFNLSTRRRTVLIVDDEEINREILGLSLEDDYELLFAGDGIEALEVMRDHSETLSLVLLDLMMPRLPGLEVLKQMKEDPAIANLPVIVVTADQTMEIASLGLGAVDFIPKPYPQAGVIQARVKRTIELYEDREIIQSTERDPLTSLYNREYFYRYAGQYDQNHKDQEMDAILLDVNRFHMINERYGKSYADSILKRIGQKLLEKVHQIGGIVCRREADTFLIYCPHQSDYKPILDYASVGYAGDDVSDDRVHLRMGVYGQVDKNIDIERRFDRAKIAADTVRNSYTQSIGIYDKALHDREMYSAQLIEDFRTAIAEGQFIVYFQPKFDIRPEVPFLSSAEALIRWQHPDMGMISPGIFIPLFEDNGLVRELDTFVWRETARQIRDWKDRLGFSVPVSVNVSRVDMYDSDLTPTLCGILEEFGLTTSDLLLEITESAYTEDSDQIIQKVNSLRDIGFKVEMDDFGTGYSSLNMISSLPIDALKLDMLFIRNAFREKKDTRMLEVIIDIADYLSVPVIAEGVETEEQLHALRAMGCDIVQGYYFSRPVPAAEFEPFLRVRISLGELVLEKKPERLSEEEESQEEMAFSRISNALAAGYESIYYVDTVSNHYLEFSSRGKYQELQIQTSGADFFADCQSNLKRVVYPEDQGRVSLSLGKDSLLGQLKGNEPFLMTYRLVVSGVPSYYTLKAVRARGKDDPHIVIGVCNMEKAIHGILTAEDRSVPMTRGAQMVREDLAGDLTYGDIAQALAADCFCIFCVDLSNDSYFQFSAHGSYLALGIEESGPNFFSVGRKNVFRVIHPDDHTKLLRFFTKEVFLQELELHDAFSMTYRLMVENNPLWVEMKAVWIGAPEDLRAVVAVRSIDPQVKRENSLFRELDAARQQARRDSLTGVKSLHAFQEAGAEMDRHIKLGDAMPFAVAVCDVNDMTNVNETLGRSAGDEYLKTACRIICDIFKHSPVFRIAGDQFAAILQGQDYRNREILAVNFTQLDRNNLNAGDPVVSFGIAALHPEDDTEFQQVFKRANKAMVENKKLWRER